VTGPTLAEDLAGIGVSPKTARLLTANADRTAAAAARDIPAAQLILNHMPPGSPPVWADIAKARIALPDANWAEIGAAVGITKDSAVSHFRRARKAVNC
jgi:DNA-binding transcriptional regulator WhiA